VELRAALEAKLGAMRRSDVDGMLKTSRREGDLAAEVSTLDEERCRIVSELCKALDVPLIGSARTVTLSALLVKLDRDSGERLAGLATHLREEMLKLAETNRVVELVCREMLAHFKTLFSAMVRSDEDGPTYSQSGEMGPSKGTRVFDTVG
jgi:hypothetical protein